MDLIIYNSPTKVSVSIIADFSGCKGFWLSRIDTFLVYLLDFFYTYRGPSGGIGRRTGLKIPSPYGRGGSIPPRAPFMFAHGGGLDSLGCHHNRSKEDITATKVSLPENILIPKPRLLWLFDQRSQQSIERSYGLLMEILLF